MTLLTLAQGVALLLALSLIYMAAFMYEDEEGKIQDSLESWWVRLSDLGGNLARLQTAVLKKSASLTDSVLDRLFGSRIWSRQAIGVSASLSFASILGAAWVVPLAAPMSYPLLPWEWWPPIEQWGFNTILPLLLLYGALRPLWGKPFSGAVEIAMGLFVAYWVGISAVFGMEMHGVILAAMIGAVASDILFIAVSRRLMRRIAMDASARLSWIFLAAYLGLLFVLFVLPFLLIEPDPGYFLSPAAVLAGVTLGNVPVAAFAALLLGITAVLVTGRTVVNAFQRPVYALQRHKVIGNKKILVAWAVALLAFSGAGVAKLVARLVRVVAG